MIVTQFDMTTLEELGLLKMDFLGLRTLTVMSDTVKMIKENRGIDIDLDKIDFEDKNVYNMIGEGKQWCIPIRIPRNDIIHEGT